jgi:hypothetical protein
MDGRPLVRLGLTAAFLGVAACGPAGTDSAAPAGESPQAVQQSPILVPSDRAPAAPAVLPPLPAEAFPAARSPEIVMAAYEFAARHPEILRYVPCFCGCERSGHGDNEDCFVKGRTADGQVVWDPHGAT